MLTSSPLWCRGYLGALFWDTADEMICCLIEDRWEACRKCHIFTKIVSEWVSGELASSLLWVGWVTSTILKVLTCLCSISAFSPGLCHASPCFLVKIKWIIFPLPLHQMLLHPLENTSHWTKQALVAINSSQVQITLDVHVLSIFGQPKCPCPWNLCAL